MRDRDAKHLLRAARERERRIGLLDANVHVLAAKLQAAIPKHGARQQPGLEQNLEAVADAEHRPAGGGELLDRSHHRREARDRAGPQVVAVRETAWKNHRVRAAKIGLLVPDELGFLAEHVLRRVIRVVIAVGSGKDNDRESHYLPSTSIR